MVTETLSLDGPCDAFYLAAASLDELEAARTTVKWARQTELPEYRAEPGCNAALYRRRFSAVRPDVEACARIRIGAAMIACRVWLNGRLLGEHWGGYTPFDFDATAALRDGHNELVIGVVGEHAALSTDGRAARCPMGVSGQMLGPATLARWQEQFGLERPCSRFGVWQSVQWVTRPTKDIEDIFVFADPGLTALEFEVSHTLPPAAVAAARWRATIRQLDGKIVGERSFDPDGIEPPLSREMVPAGRTRGRWRWPAPPLQPWSPARPRLYRFELSCETSGMRRQRSVRFGWRTFGIDGGYFMLNGRKTILRGEGDLFQNRGYQFYGPHGLDIAALLDSRTVRAYLAHLKRELGINAVRVHAAIGSPSVFTAADEVGLLVESQSSVWSRGMSFYRRGGDAFLKQASAEAADWVRRDRNHPCIVLWGVENEMLRITAPRPNDRAFFLRLGDIFQAIDPTRPRTFDGGAAVCPQLEISHVHHEENYDVLLRAWRRDRPLVLGEFWIGGRNAERRLTNGAEFADAAEFFRETNRLWASKILGLRLGGASGVMPYSFSAQVLRSVGRAAQGPGRERGQPRGPWSEGWLRLAHHTPLIELDADGRRQFRHALGPCLVEFATRRQALYTDDGAVRVPVIIRNDTETLRGFTLTWACDGAVAGRLETGNVSPGDAWQGDIVLEASEECARHVELTLHDAAHGTLDSAQRTFALVPRAAAPPPPQLARPLFVIADATTEPYFVHLRSRGFPVRKIAPDAIGSVPPGALLIVTPDRIARRQTELDARQVCGIVVEGPGTLAGWLGTGGIFDLRQPYLHSNHFEAILGRPVEVADLYHPHEAVVEDPDHPTLARWGASRVTAFDDREGDMLACGVIVHPGMTLGNIVGDMSGVGAALDAGDGGSAPAASASGSACLLFRPLLSGPRREYATMAELTTRNTRWLAHRLRLGAALGQHPWADAWLHDALVWLDSAPAGHQARPTTIPASSGAVLVWDACTAPPGPTAWSEAACVIIHSLATADNCAFAMLRTQLGRVRRIAPAERVNHVAVEAGGFFAASKSRTILEEPLPFDRALVWEEAGAVVGGWRLLQCDSSFEVRGHGFPWSWRSDYPRSVGFAAVHLYRHGRDFLLLLENPWADHPVVQERYRVVLDNVRRHFHPHC